MNLRTGSQQTGRSAPLIELIGPAEGCGSIVTAERISRLYGLNRINAELLIARGFKPGARLKRYLEPSIAREMGDPLLLKNVERGFRLLIDTLKEGRDIAVFCDFDVDGVTAAWQQHMTLSVLRDALGSSSKIEVTASRRLSGGYGVDPEAARSACRNGAGLIITLDMGTQQGALFRELEREFNVKTLVNDHHSPGRDDVPPPLMINPRQRGEKIKYKNLSAGGLVYVQKKAYENLLKKERKPWAGRAAGTLKSLEADYLSFATLSTVADVMPLAGLNRAIVRAGLVCLTQMAATPDNQLVNQQWQRRALVGLMQACGLRHKDLASQDISYRLGPVLNALGRLIDDGAQRAVDFFRFPDLRVVETAVSFVENNRVRKETEAEAVRRTIAACEAQICGNEAPPAVVVLMPDMHPGVQGIVAARVRDHFFRTAGVGTSPEGTKISFSFRGIRLRDGSDVSIKQAFEHPAVKAILEREGNKGGGHAAAGGCTIKNDELGEFRAAMQLAVAAQIEGHDAGRFVRYDRVSTLREILAASVTMVKEQKRVFGPCGKDNPEPQHLLEGLTVMTVTEVGKSLAAGRHLRHWCLKLREEAVSEGEKPAYVDAMLWFAAEKDLPKPGTRINVVAELGIDRDRSPHNEALQRVLLDIKNISS